MEWIEEQHIDGDLVGFLSSIAHEYPNKDDIIFLCIGSDRSTGDSFGPLVGTMLIEAGWEQVIGCLEHPCDAYQVEQSVVHLASCSDGRRKVVIAIDACLGKPSRIGAFVTRTGPLQPGAATGRRLPLVGHYSIAGVVNQFGPKAYIKLQTTSLHHVIQMAKKLVMHIQESWIARNHHVLPIE